MTNKCKKHQWDYIVTGRIGDCEAMMENPETAIWICPYCEKFKLIELNGGKLKNE